MLTRNWHTSSAHYDVEIHRSQPIPLPDGSLLNCDIFRPRAAGKYPAIVGVHPYSLSMQTDPIRPNSFSSVAGLHPGEEKPRGSIEAGDPWFYARRGYAHIIVNVRGTGMSEGSYGFLDRQEASDTKDVIEWVAQQPWCNGSVGMFGVSYFAMSQHRVAALRPKGLSCLFAPWGSTPLRDIVYPGGILNARWVANWVNDLDNPRIVSTSLCELGEEGFRQAVAKLLEDDDIMAVPELASALQDPSAGRNALIADILLHDVDGEYWQERTPAYKNIDIPVYLGACWGTYGLHLRSLSRAWEQIPSFKRMVIGPPAYLDRPVSQMQYESLRWFDHWLKGMETGLMEDAPVRAFVMGSNDWRESDEWPLSETRWVPFYLHEGGLLSERDHWWAESHDTFFDSPWHRGGIEYWSPPLVDNVEVIGPLGLELFAATSSSQVRWIVSFLSQDAAGDRRLLTKGVLDGDFQPNWVQSSPPYDPQYDFSKRGSIVPFESNVFKVPIVPTSKCFMAGSRFGVRISCVDDIPTNPLESTAAGHLRSQRSRRVAVYHDSKRPSCLWVPITRGNILGTFLSGGVPYVNQRS